MAVRVCVNSYPFTIGLAPFANGNFFLSSLACRFAGAATGLQCVHLSIERMYDRDVYGRYGRSFGVILPLMHSEDLADHDMLTERLNFYCKIDPAGPDSYKAEIDFEHEHRVIIEQFGRYPYRNAVLGRETTPEEATWLESGESFGQ